MNDRTIVLQGVKIQKPDTRPSNDASKFEATAFKATATASLPAINTPTTGGIVPSDAAQQIARPTAERAQGIEQRRSTTNGTRHPDPESATGFGDDRRTSKVATEVRLAGDYGVGAVSERTEGMLPNPGETPTGSANDGEANGGGSGNEDEEDTDLDDDRRVF